jgi:branched-chain amino acid aminotransferase
MHRFILHNDDIRDVSDKVLSPGQVGLLAGWGVFSTLRVSEGVPFAFERHWERMRRDAVALRVPMPASAEYVRSGLLRLIEANHAAEATLRVAIVRNRGGIWEGPSDRECDVIGLTTEIKKWGEGVKLDLHGQARHTSCGFRGVKILSWSQNLVMLEDAQEKGYDEVILLNERGEVSECTSANIFVVRGSSVATPPLDSGCLPGVTRDVLLEEVRVEGVKVEEALVRPEDLETADAVFITSTTRDLLPVLSVQGRALRQAGGVREALQAAFVRYRDGYIGAHKGAPAQVSRS